MPPHDCTVIIARSAPALIIDEDDRSITFRPLEPSIRGQALVVRKLTTSTSTRASGRRSRGSDGVVSTPRVRMARRSRLGVNVLHGVEKTPADRWFTPPPPLSTVRERRPPRVANPDQTREEMHATFRIET